MDAGIGTGHASADGLRIAFESEGIGSTAVIFIHGAFEDRSYFASQVNHMAQGRRVVALDLRGHGESDTPADVSVEAFAADVIGAAEESGVESAYIIGHSMGGVVALLVAEQRPELVSGIGMLDGTILFPEAVRRQGLENLVPALETDHWLEALRGYFGRTFDPNDPPEVAARVMSDLALTNPKFARSLFTSLFATDFSNQLKNVRCPLLYVRAKAPVDLPRLLELRPDAMVGQVVGSGHYLMLSVPDQVNVMLDRFEEAVDDAGPPR
jgi:pimeloyl-ACP methyl ester carboxylesterase